MSKGISDAQEAKEKLWTDSDFNQGKIKSIRLMDRDNQCCSPNERQKKHSIPVYGQIEVEFDDGVYSTIPCTLKEAEEYSIGQKASIELVIESSDD